MPIDLTRRFHNHNRGMQTVGPAMIQFLITTGIAPVTINPLRTLMLLGVGQ